MLPKADGGRRPIGLFPAIIRVWARSRSHVARRWESDNARGCLFGGPGMGAQKAAWQSGFRAEAAALNDCCFAQSLLDLVKAFEKIPHHVLARLAVKFKFNLWLLRLSLASNRVIGIDGSFSRPIQAVRGITAGSVFATTELRIIMIEAMDATTVIWKTVVISVYVDDCTLEAAGPGDQPTIVVAGATDTLVHFLEKDLELEVSAVKSVATASCFSSAVRMARMTRTRKVRPVRSAKLLGTPAAGGRRRSTKVQQARLLNVKCKAKRVKFLARTKANRYTRARAADTLALTYGWDIMGLRIPFQRLGGQRSHP